MSQQGTLLDPASLNGMGIRQQPFVPPQEDALFADESLELQVRMLRHNLQYSNMLQVIYGAPGAGKTCLAIRLVSVVNQELELFLVRGERGLTSARIIADLLRALDREATGDSENDRIVFANELSADSGVDAPAALVVDDAHLLERQEMARLLDDVVQIDTASAHGFHLLLIAEPSLQGWLENLDSPLLAPGRTYSTTIKPLSIEQAGAYLAHRLSQVGASWPFNDDEVAAIAEAAAGLPGDINQAAVRTLNHKFSTEVVEESAPAPVSGAHRKPGLIRTGLAGLIVLGAIAWALWPDQDTPTPTAEKPLALPEAPLPAEPQALFKDETPPTALPPQPRSEPAPQPAPVPLPTPAAQPAHEPTAEPAPALKPDPEPEPEAKPAAKPESEPEPAAAPAPATASSDAAWLAANGVQDAGWLRGQARQHYVVQLMAARDLSVLREFIESNQLGNKAAVFLTHRDGLPWHVLVYGLYRDAQAARNAIGRLPERLRRHAPWIRSIGSVHEALRTTP